MQHSPESCPRWMKQTIDKETFTKVTSPLGSTARACRFESCCPHQEKGDRKVSLFLVRATGLEEGGTANGGEKTCLRHVF